MVNAIDPRLADINMEDAPEVSSFIYVGRVVAEEWKYLSLEERTGPTGHIKNDVPYWHLAVQPLSYTINDGGQRGDNLEHTEVGIFNKSGEMQPKNSGRGELWEGFRRVGLARNTTKDLETNSAVGKVFRFKRYRRRYGKGETAFSGELMNVPMEELPSTWQPEPGTEVPSVSRAYRPREGSENPTLASGSVTQAPTKRLEDVAPALRGVSATNAAVKQFVLTHPEFGVAPIVDFALEETLLDKLQSEGLVTVANGVIA